MSRTIGTSFTLCDQAMRNALDEIQRNFVDYCLTSAGLAIGSGSKKKVLIANTVYASIDGALVKKTTAEITLTTANNVANAKFNVIVLSMDASGTVTPTNGTEAATLGAVVFPEVPEDEVVLGFVIINPTGTGGFVGGTTDLDDGTVAPNAVYINTIAPFNMNILSI